MGLSTGIGVGITYGFPSPPFDTVNTPNRRWHFRAGTGSTVGGTMTLTDLVPSSSLTLTGATHPTLTTFPVTGAPSLLFNGTTHHLDSAGGGLPTTTNGIYTMVWVGTYTSTANQVAVALNNSAGGGLALGRSVGGTGIMAWKVSSVFDDVGSIVAVNAPFWQAYTFKVAQSAAYSSKMYVNGALVAGTGSAGNLLAPIGSGFGVGWFPGASTFFHGGHEAEWMLCDGDLGAATLGQINGYMQRVYGTP